MGALYTCQTPAAEAAFPTTPRKRRLSNRKDPAMSDRPKFFDDLAGVAGGAISALAGLREEAEAMIRARLDDLIQRLDLVRREELEAIQELAANARAGQERAEATVGDMETRLAALEARVSALETPDHDAVAAEGL
jgi:BMFP domain-containing protein YqiC